MHSDRLHNQFTDFKWYYPEFFKFAAIFSLLLHINGEVEIMQSLVWMWNELPDIISPVLVKLQLADGLTPCRVALIGGIAASSMEA